MKYLGRRIAEQVKQYAESERAAGGRVKIDRLHSTVAVHCSDGSEYFFQGEEAEQLLDTIPDNVTEDDWVMSMSINW